MHEPVGVSECSLVGRVRVYHAPSPHKPGWGCLCVILCPPNVEAKNQKFKVIKNQLSCILGLKASYSKDKLSAFLFMTKPMFLLYDSECCFILF